jgi:SnoaL-like domain
MNDSTHLFEAREDILRLMNEYCYRIDLGDLEGFAALFGNGSLAVTGDPNGPYIGRQGVMKLAENVILYESKPQTKHVMTNVQIDVADSGTEAAAQCYVIVFQALPPEFPMQAIFGGHYHDRFVKREQVWSFASREISPDLLGDLSRHRADMA